MTIGAVSPSTKQLALASSFYINRCGALGFQGLSHLLHQNILLLTVFIKLYLQFHLTTERAQSGSFSFSLLPGTLNQAFRFFCL